MDVTNNKQDFYSHILNLNTVALQISKETLFDAGISNRIKNNENYSQHDDTEADL